MAQTYSSETIQMKPGERVLLVTDGVTEAEDPSGEFYGDDRLQAIVMSGTTIEELFHDVETFMRGAPPNDDCTMLEICYASCG